MMVRKPIINEMWVRLVGVMEVRRIFLARTAVITPTRLERITSRFPTTDSDEPKVFGLMNGSTTIMRVPTKAIAMPTFSLLVTCSRRKATPAAATIIGEMAPRTDPESEEVLSNPQKRRVRDTVEVRNP